MRRLCFLLVFLATVFILSYDLWYFILREAKSATWYEVLLKGGTVVDGTGRKPYQADVLIRGAKVVALGENLAPPPGVRIINVRGSYLAPGFIELRPGLLPPNTEQEKLIKAGVTTVVGGDKGSSPLEIGKYLNTIAQGNPRLNYGMLLGLGSVRAQQVKYSLMTELIQKGLAEGALGLSLDLNFLPDALWTWQELREVLRNVGPPAPLLVINFSDEAVFRGQSLLASLREVLEAAEDVPFALHLRNFRFQKKISPGVVSRIKKELGEAYTAGGR